MRAALYIRVSTDEQAREGFSIRAQKNQLVNYCRDYDYEIANIYIDDGFSAKDTKRPKLKELLQAAEERSFDAVIVHKLDRFTRSVKDLYELLEFLQSYGIGFISKQEKFDTTSAMGRAMIGMLGVFAQFERELIAERVRFGVEQKVKEGKRPGGRVPFGYDKDENMIEEEAEQIRLVRKLYMSGMSYQGVAAFMHRKNYMRRGYEWTATNVALTLENPYYAGIIRYGERQPNGKYPQRMRELRVNVIEAKGSHEPIWTVAEFEEHIARMRRRSTGGYSKKMEYWFNGVLRCGRCGAAMYGRLTTVRSLKDGTPVRTPYYWCSKRKENKSCDMPMFRQVHVEHLIMEHIKQIRIDKDRVRAHQEDEGNKSSDRKKELSKLRRELEKIRSRIKKWQYAFAEDLIDENDFKKRMEEEHEEETKITEMIETLREPEEVVVSDRLFELADIWPRMDDIEKQEIIGTLFDRITLITELSNVKGVKNAFFPAEIKVEYNE